jgi:hypothetical protein
LAAVSIWQVRGDSTKIPAEDTRKKNQLRNAGCSSQLQFLAVFHELVADVWFVILWSVAAFDPRVQFQKL